MKRNILSRSIAVGLLVAASWAEPARPDDDASAPDVAAERAQTAVAVVTAPLDPPSRPPRSFDTPPPPAPTPGAEAGPVPPRKVLSLGDASTIDVSPKLKVEARAVSGDVLKSADKQTWVNSHDSYVRKIRFGAGGHFLSRGKYTVTYVAENLGRTHRSPTLEIDKAYADWTFAEVFAVRVGRAQLPLSRGVLLSSSSVFIDEAKVTDEASDVFEDDDQLQLQLGGRVLDGVLSYYAAIANGWSQGAELDDFDQGGTVLRGQPLLVARAELALPGFAQPLAQTRPGKGRRISIGGSFSTQRGIRYAGLEGHEDRTLAAIDVTARVDAFSAIVEGIAWRVDSTLPKVGHVRPWGWYAQTGWYVHALRLEPIVRYEHLREGAEAGASQQAISFGTTWYVLRDGAKLQVNYVHRTFGPESHDRLKRAGSRSLLELGTELSF